MDPNRKGSRLSVLGPPDLRNAGNETIRSVLAQPRRVALLAFVRLAESGEPVTRDALLGTFWPELPEERALNALRQALHFLRRSLGPEAVTRTGDHLVSIPAQALSCDAADFESLVAAERHSEAMALYRGLFLDGLPVDGTRPLEEWIERQRGRFQRMAIESCASLSEESRRAGQNVAAADWARRLIELDPLEERGVALLFEAYAAEGDAVAALRSYAEYETRLREELGLAASEELSARVREVAEAASDAYGATPGAPDGETASAHRKSASLGEGAAEIGEPPARATVEAAGVPATASSETAPAGPARRRWFPLLAGVAAIVVASVAVGRAMLPGARGPAPVPGMDPSRPSVAVLPLTNLSADSANAYFAAGVHESLLVTLSKIGSLDVSSLQAVRPYAGTDLPVTEIARALSVSSLMSGSVQRDGGRIRIIVELVDASDGSSIWSEAYERRLDDVFGVQAEIARSVANALSAALTPTEETRIAQRPTADLEALDAYMRARQAYQRLSPDGMEEAIEQYRAAATRDPAFAAAWAGWADALLQRVQFFGYPMAWADSARRLVEHAIELDPDLPEAYKTLGFVHSVRGQSRAALDAAERALALRPAYAEALNNAGWSRYSLGDVAGAERLIGRSFRLQPTVPQLRSNVGAIWAALGRVDEAETWLDGVLEADPGITATRTWRVFTDIQGGDPRGALARARAYVVDEEARGNALARAAFAATLARDMAAALEYARAAAAAAPGADLLDLRRAETLLGFALVTSGDPDGGAAAVQEGIEEVRRAAADGSDGWDPPWELASAYAALGRREESLSELARAVEEGFPYPVLLRLDPTFDLLRSDARFEDLVQQAETEIARQRLESLAGPS